MPKPGLARPEDEEQSQKHRSQLCTQCLPAPPGAKGQRSKGAEGQRDRGAAISHKPVGNLGGVSGHTLSYCDFSTNTPAIEVVSLASVVSLDQRIHVHISQERVFYSLKTWIQTRCKLSVCNYIK